MSKPKMSELLFAAARAADPYANMQAMAQAAGPNWQGGFSMSTSDLEAAKQTSRILSAIATVFKAHEDAEETQ